MKKTLLSVFALFTFLLCNAQVKTYSNYDVDGNGEVSISDVTKLVNRVLEKLSDNRTLVDGENLYALMLSTDARLRTIEEKLNISPIAESVVSAEHANNESLNTLALLIEARLKAIEDRLGVPSIDESIDNNGHEYVDLGLPSGLKWATCNVGASKPEEYGDYFAWGETEPYYIEGHSQDINCSKWKTGKTEGYYWPSYKWCNGSSSKQTKYCTDSSYGKVDNKTVLDLKDDAAYVNWEGDWRMPTEEEMDELYKNCYWKWVTSYKGKSVNGYIVYKVQDSADKGKYSSSYCPVGSYSVYSDPHIFLPAAGYRFRSGVGNIGSGGGYWLTKLGSYNSSRASVLSFDSTHHYSSISDRCDGRTIRPVCP